MPVPQQEDEVNSHEALRRQCILSGDSDAVFNDIANLAAQVCQAPLARITLSHSEKYWFSSSVEVDFSDQDPGCCVYTMRRSGLFEVEDTHEDKRFASAPSAILSPGIRFYAGLPLIREAGNVEEGGSQTPTGTLCVMDYQPRRLTAEQKKNFASIARLLTHQLELRQNMNRLKEENTKRDKTEKELQRTLSLLEATLESTTDGILVIDRHRNIVRYNQRLMKMWHVSDRNALSGKCGEVMKHFQSQLKDPDRFLSKMAELDPLSETNSFDVLEFKDGRIFERYSNPQKVGGGNIGRVWSFRDTTEQHEQAALLQHQALHDGLTNLPNRTLLQDRLQQAILLGRRQSRSLAVLLMDLDRFKEINDTLGHRYGDLLLKQIGPRIASALRKSDTIARLGGDEFAILLQGPITEDEACTFARKILNALETSFVIEGMNLDVGASIGVAIFPDHGDQAQMIIQHADIAMYTAKTSGIGIAVYSEEQDQYSVKRLILKGDLRHAIENGELFLLYQPKVNLQSGLLTGVEALVRWQHRQFGVVPPDQFISLAEQTGLIKPLTLYVLKTALYQSLSWRKEGLNLPVSVNLSVRSLRDPRLIDQVVELLQLTGSSPESIELEITESIIMDDPTRAMEIVSCLGKIGVPFSIDDFGTGYSSLGYLKRFPVQSIKIDKIFIRDMTAGGEDEMIVRSIIELAHNLHLKVIAEGVEKVETWDRLSALRCDEAQGYFLSPPVTGQEVVRWQKKWETGRPVQPPVSTVDLRQQ